MVIIYMHISTDKCIYIYICTKTSITCLSLSLSLNCLLDQPIHPFIHPSIGLHIKIAFYISISWSAKSCIRDNVKTYFPEGLSSNHLQTISILKKKYKSPSTTIERILVVPLAKSTGCRITTPSISADEVLRLDTDLSSQHSAVGEDPGSFRKD